MTEKEEKEFNADVRRRQVGRARREAMAAAGDVDAVWAELTRPRPAPVDTETLFPLLLRAVEVRARRSPELFSSEILAKIVSLTSFLTLRSHYLLTKRIEQFDRSPQGRGRVELPPAFTEKVIPQLMDLQRSLCEILHAQAAVLRMHELARAKRIENDGAGSKPPAKATPDGKAEVRRKPASTQARVNGKNKGNVKAPANGEHHGNGKPVNRLAGLLDGLGLTADGVHQDG